MDILLYKNKIKEIEENLPTARQRFKVWNIWKKKIYSIRYRLVKDELDNIPCTKILDVGCGDGALLNYFCNLNTFDTYVGIDFSRKKIKTAKDNVMNSIFNVHFIVADLQYLPFREEVFHFVVLVDVLEHLIEPKKEIADLYRVTKRGGFIIILTPSAYRWRKNEKLLFNLKNISLSIGDRPPLKRDKTLQIGAYEVPHRDFTRRELISIFRKRYRILKFYNCIFTPLHTLFRLIGINYIVDPYFIEVIFNKFHFPISLGDSWLLKAKKA